MDADTGILVVRIGEQNVDTYAPPASGSSRVRAYSSAAFDVLALFHLMHV